MAASPPRRRRPASRLILPVAIALGALVLADTLAWGLAERRIDRLYAQWQAAQTAQGWRVAASPPSRGGWPFAAGLDLRAVSLADASGLGWQADRVRLRVSLLHPLTLGIAAGGAQALLLGPAGRLPFTAARLALSVPFFPDARTPQAALVAEGVRADLPGGALVLGRLRAALAAPPALAVVASAANVTLPPAPGGTWPLGARIATVSLDAGLTGAVPPGKDPAAQARAWRAAGGRLAVRRLALTWGRLDLTAQATLGLDAALQPEGSGEVVLADPAALLDALAAGHAITPQAEATARVVVGLLAPPPKPGVTPDLHLPLTLKDHLLTVGGVPVARLPDWHWPSAP
ncbi:MAG: DUF2125 domain-containing protein [Rhodospirillales bacterium]|nr:DUF2125 domain-containing protein [Rhodospirillales bacterium]